MPSAPRTIDITPYGSAIDPIYRYHGTKEVYATISDLPRHGSVIFAHRSELLAFAYISTVLASPLGDSNPLIGEGLALLTFVILLAGASYIVSRQIARTIVLPVAALWLVARTIEAFGYRHFAYVHLSPAAGLVLSIVVLLAILRRLAAPPVVTTGIIAEAFIGYLTLATAFAQVYWMLNHFFVSPFNQTIPESHLSTILYFSMITLTSVGYGGIAPINSYLRIVAAFECMFGIFYIAVVVARLASSYGLNRKL